LKNYLFNANFVLSRNRHAWIDYTRGICIILVCYRHCFEGLNTTGIVSQNYPLLKYLNVFLFSFRMPLFFLISGLFVSASLSKKGLANYISDRFKIIYYPLLIWGVLQISLQLFFADYVNAQRQLIDYWYLIVQPRKIEQFWYLNALFLVGIIYATIKVKFKLTTKQHIILALVFYATGAYLHHIQSKAGAYMFTDVFHYYLFFAIGNWVGPVLLHHDVVKTYAKATYLVPFLLLFVVTHYFFTKINLDKGIDFYVEHYVPAYFLAVSLTGCAFIILIAMGLQRMGMLKFLRIIGYHSLYIYVMHLIVLAGARTILKHALHITNIPLLMFLAITMAIVIPVAVYNVVSKGGGWWLFTLKKPEDEINYCINRAVKRLQ
jgi:fucose 4-O-acetylase-like acetyltransferase